MEERPKRGGKGGRCGVVIAVNGKGASVQVLLVSPLLLCTKRCLRTFGEVSLKSRDLRPFNGSGQCGRVALQGLFAELLSKLNEVEEGGDTGMAANLVDAPCANPTTPDIAGSIDESSIDTSEPSTKSGIAPVVPSGSSKLAEVEEDGGSGRGAGFVDAPCSNPTTSGIAPLAPSCLSKLDEVDEDGDTGKAANFVDASCANLTTPVIAGSMNQSPVDASEASTKLGITPVDPNGLSKLDDVEEDGDTGKTRADAANVKSPIQDRVAESSCSIPGPASSMLEATPAPKRKLMVTDSNELSCNKCMRPEHDHLGKSRCVDDAASEQVCHPRSDDSMACVRSQQGSGSQDGPALACQLRLQFFMNGKMKDVKGRGGSQKHHIEVSHQTGKPRIQTHGLTNNLNAPVENIRQLHGPKDDLGRSMLVVETSSMAVWVTITKADPTQLKRLVDALQVYVAPS